MFDTSDEIDSKSLMFLLKIFISYTITTKIPNKVVKNKY